MKTAIVNSTAFVIGEHRIDPSIHMSEGVAVRRALNNMPYKLSTVGENSQKVFLGNIFSRVFVKGENHGVPYLSASDTVLSNINTGRFLSNKQSSELSYLKLKENWILMTCSGTLGKITYTGNYFEDYIATHDLIRIIPNDGSVNKGTLYAFLASKYGYYQITQSKFGGVVKHINDDQAKDILIPIFPTELQLKIESLVLEAKIKKETATEIYKKANSFLLSYSKLGNINETEYDYYGPSLSSREVSCFSIKRKSISTTTINAFNLSERNALLKSRIYKTVTTKSLIDCLDEKGLFSTGSFPRIEVAENYGIELINQRDIFDSIIKGKFISKRGVKLDNLVSKDEVIIAGVGTLGESETFCRCVYGNSYLTGKLISGEFIRMKSKGFVPSGFLYLWLSSEYGFRLIRNTQAGTKLCRPIPKLLEQIPVPVLDKEKMDELDKMVKESQELFAIAAFKELEAISLVEAEIEKWTKQ